MKPTVHISGIHLPGQKIVLIYGLGEALEKIDIPSLLERYLGRPIDNLYDHLTYIGPTLGILSMPVQPPVILIMTSASLSASPVQKRIVQFVS
jgi:hypothetical protein